MAKTKDFEVNINLNKNFVKCLDSLFDKYGEEMRSLNGF